MTQFQWKRTHAAELRTYWSNFDASSQFADNFALQQSTFPPIQVPASFSPISSWRPGVSLKAIGTDAQTQDASQFTIIVVHFNRLNLIKI